MKSSKGFTLIEILVVIAILAGLVSILFPNFMEMRLRARDAQRKSDLRQLQKALEFYKTSTNPPSYPADGTIPEPCSEWKVGNNLYMAKVPGDPNGSCIVGGTKLRYYYHLKPYDPTDPVEYLLYACLENKNDPEGEPCTPLAPYFQNVVPYGCDPSWCYKVTNP